ncbi:MAG: InlB B-repeat-containing protein [Subdoligranulum variabile]|nr:InlB B-repeat-containing protein [Subdoligranulum variabile]
MKKKTLATASLLLALLMPLGATPLAVYADEAQTGISAVSEDSEGTDKDKTNENSEGTDKDKTNENPEEKDKDKTNENPEEKDKDKTNENPEEKDKDKTNENSEVKDKGKTNDGSEADAVYAEGEGKAQMRISAVGEAPENGNSIASTVSDGKAFVASKNQEYESLDEAMLAAADGDTIYLGKGTYCGNAAHPTVAGNGAGKSLTFVGAGTDKTTWQIKAVTHYGADGWCDYSFKGSDSITFEKMTVIGSVYPDDTTKTDNTQGLTYIQNITLKNCIFNGRADYWGYKTTTFENVIFNAPGTKASGIDTTDYSLWTLTGKSYTFKNCTFNATGKVINVYTYYSVDKNDVAVNFDSCIVNSTKANKTALNINDLPMTNAGKGFKFYVNITGNNTVNGLDADSYTCSRLFSFGGLVGAFRGYNSGSTVVKIEGKTVWENRVRTVDHNGNNFATGSYDNGTGSGSANQYTEGYKDNKFKIINTTDWTLKADTTSTYVRTITKQCQYCYEKINEQEEKTGYCLSYDLNGGTGAEGTYNDTYYPPQDGNPPATVAADPSRAGYQFAGWQDAAGNQYAAGDTVIVDHDITLTAQWNKLVTVSFDLCGHGGANISSQTFVSGNKASEPTAPKEDGWVFGGWYTEKGCKYRFSFDSAVTSDIILYAKWDRVTTVVSAPVATPTPSPAPAAAATKTATVKNAAIPQTSDAFPMEGLLALLAVGAVGFGAAGWLRKKHH